MGSEKLTGQQVSAAGLTGWTVLAGVLHTRIRSGDFATGLKIVDAIGEAAEEMNHHPDLDLRYPRVDVRLSSHDVDGLTERDLALARRISEIATAAGAELECESVSRFELGLDSPAQGEISPFWAAVLSRDVDGDDVVDPYDQGPLIWFQTSGNEPDRQRWHPDLWVDPARVQPLIDAALAAGGTLVSDEGSPSFWVLADAEGNRMCLCTWQGRG